MNYIKLSDLELEITLKTKVEEESKISLEILYLLAEVERRRLYSKQEYPSNGTTELNNLRLVCRAHNVRNAISAFGFSKMNSYINNRDPVS